MTTGAPPPSRQLVPVLVMVALVGSVVSSLGAPLLRTIARVDHVSLADAQWTLTATTMAGAVFSPVFGRIGDGPHRRRALLGSLTVVVAGCVLAAVPADSFILLVVGRAMQGLGLAVMPLAMAVARDALPAHRSAPAIAVLSVATAAGVGLGYPVTGLLEEYLGFHSAYWFGVVIALASLLLSAVYVPSGAHLEPRRLDTTGAWTLAVSLLAVIVAISEGSVWGWGSAQVVALVLAGLAGLAGWAVLELRRPGPLVELRLLRHRTVALTNLTAFMAGVALYMFLPLLTDFVQIDRRAGYGLGASVAVTGLMLVPFSVLSASMSRVARIVGVRIGEVWVVPIGAVVSAVAAAMIAVAGGQLWEAFFATGLAGVGVGFTFAAMPGLIVRSVPAAETGSALGFYQVVRFLGFTFGAAVTASLLAAYTRTGTAIPTRTGFTVAFVCSAAINLAAAGLSATVGRPGRLLPGSVPDAAAAGVVVD